MRNQYVNITLPNNAFSKFTQLTCQISCSKCQCGCDWQL